MKQLTLVLALRALTNLTLGLLISLPVMAQSTASYNWQNVAIGGGGFVSSVIADPNDPGIFYVRTDVGGSYRWEESSQSWIPLMDWTDAGERGLLGVEAIAVDPNQTGTVYMMTGTNYWNQADDGIGRSAFLRSNDYGKTWDKIYVWDNNTKYFNVHGNGMGRGNGEALAIDPANSNTIFYGSRNKGLWKSTNNGNTWSKVTSFPVDTTWNGAGISFVKFDPSTSGASETSRIYVGVLRDSDNVFVSEDGGDTWSLVPNRPEPQYAPRLMPQRIAVRPDGSKIYITFGDGAGPHTMQWDEGWGMINDWFNRGAVYEYDVAAQTWTDISPQNLIDPEGEDYTDPSTYFGCYSGLSIDPNNPDHMVVSSIASYRAPQFWLIDGAWSDQWGDNIFVTEDGGETWVASFEYYWLEGGMEPPAEQMNENGVPWIVGNTIHWIGGVAIDPNNPQRVFVTSGNGVFMTENIFNYEWSYENEWGDPDTSYTQYTEWKFAGHGIEETVPEDVVSIPGGPMVSVIADYDGFVHQDVTQYPDLGRHTTLVDGSEFVLGTTRGLAFAPQSGKLAKVADTRTVSTEYNDIPIGPVQYSTDNGATWTVETYTSNPPTGLSGGKLTLTADGAATLWMPATGTTMYRHSGSSWTEVNGIDFNGRPVADWIDASLVYVYNRESGYMYVSNDGGVSFSQAGFAGSSNFRTASTVPGEEGHIWVPIAQDDGSGGLMRSSDGGASFSSVPGVGYCEAVGFGKAADGAGYPAVYVFAEIDGVLGVFRSVDEGASWVRVNDDEHEYGGLANGEFVRGDMNVFGRVYMSTAGRGIVYGEPTGQAVPVTGVNVSPVTATIAVGGNQQLTATVSPSNATNQSVSWSTSNSSVATVNTNGVVSGVSTGEATITATTADGGYTAAAVITVEETGVPVTGVSVSPTSASVNEGETTTLTATISPADATNQQVSWSSDNASVAAVNTSGVVTGIAQGVAIITVTTEDGGYTAASTISVSSETGGGTGTIVREYWNNISGTQISSLTSHADYPDNPSGSEELTSLEGPVNWADNYGTRIRGYVHAPATGDYTFWVAGDDYTDLYLSTDDSPSNASRIAYVEGWTSSREWNKYASQQSASISLTAGQKYYIEVLHKEGSGGDNVAVAWEGPGIAQAVIDGQHLSPFDGQTGGGNNDPEAAVTASVTSGVAPLTVDFDASGSSDPDGDALTYSWTFGDGSTATGVAPSHTYNSTGTFTATVTVDDGNGGTDNASVNITVTEDTPDQFTLNTATTGSGTVSLDPAGGTYNEGTVVTVTATATPGWEFDSWSGDLSGSANPTTVTMNSDHSITANFTEVVATQYTLTTSTNGSGSISLSPSGGVYDEGTTVTVTANPVSGWVFDNWSGDLSGTANPESITMNADHSIAANFSEPGDDPCDSPIAISVPFAFDGTGDFCWVTSEDIANINSWNLNSLTINGVDYTNSWSNSFPAKIDGNYYIEYSSSVPWGHFEAAALSSAPLANKGENAVSAYPVPFTDALTLEIIQPEQVRQIIIFDNAGRTMRVIGQADIKSVMEIGSDLEEGMYIIKVDHIHDVQTFNVIKN